MSMTGDPETVTLEYLAEQQRQTLSVMCTLLKEMQDLSEWMLSLDDSLVAALGELSEIRSLLSMEPAC